MAGIGVLGTMTPDYVGKSQVFWRNTIAAESMRSDKFKEQEDPGKTAGGGIMAAAGGVTAGLMATGADPIGGVVGGIVGLAGYAFG